MSALRKINACLGVTAAALLLNGCAPSGYVYEVGNFVRPHPTQQTCASRGQVLDMSAEDCVTPPAPPPPNPAQVAQKHQSDAITRRRNECVETTSSKYRLQADGPVASYAIWRAELKQCEDAMLSRLAAQRMKAMGADCLAKLDWMLRYRMMVYDPDQKAMAEDRYAETCGAR
jgi:hypothetical protein